MLDNYRSPWLTDEHQQFADSVRRFVTTTIAPQETQWREDKKVSREAWLAMGEMGMILPDLPVEYGGAGGDAGHVAVVNLELFGHSVGGAAIMMSHIVGHYLYTDGTPEQKRKWLPKIASGEVICSLAMTEPGTGSDLQAIRTRAEKRGDSYVINGAKTFISNGQNSDIVVVVAKTDLQAKGSKGISLFIVDTKTPGFRRGKCLDKLGQVTMDTSELYFDDVEVPADCLVGGVEGQGFYSMMKQLPYERAQVALCAVAAMQQGLRHTLAYVKERKVFGKPLLDFQNTRFVLADVKATVLAATTLSDHMVEQWIAGTLDSTLASINKFWLTERQGEVLDKCLQFFGGYGYMNEYPIARLYADARVQRIYGGTNEIQRELVGRSL